ncbi:MAG: hypothetical protein AMXMBFR58_02150 [Phycisphaerae bacterium]|nr:hypothetical protein [Phycisphaerales bacterium]
MTGDIQDVLSGVALFVALVAALESGYRLGQRAADEGDTRGAGQVGAIQGAMLGLLGLLLGFSFAAAGARFLERQDLIVSEANAIGTAYYRAELLDDPHRSDLRRALAEYTRDRLNIASRIRDGLSDADHARVGAYHAHMWNAARAGVELKPAFALAVLDPVNSVIDLHTTRLAASNKHVPGPVIWLLVACSMLSVGVIGYGCGTSRRRRAPLSLSLAALISCALWLTIDLDHPRAGLLQLSDAPLEALRLHVEATPPAMGG